MKKLPIGIQSFSNLRDGSNDYLYIDKTMHILEMIENGTIYFFSRPRRFGKSLLVSTMNELFNGNKELFEGLYIFDKWDWNKKNTVIKLDFGVRANRTPQELEKSLEEFLKNTALSFNVELISSALSDKFYELIEKLHLTTGEKVVVLIDEYDKPIIDNMPLPQVRNDNKKILHDFYQVLNAADDHLRFIFLTGISKFSGMSIFSGLNNIHDISLSDKYSSICGYTQEELEDSFSEYIEVVSKKFELNRQNLIDKIQEMYDGYSWDGVTRVYNPFSTLVFFSEGKFENHWFRTGTPTFLIDIIKERNQVVDILKPQIVDNDFFESADIDEIEEVSLLFQTGYLTIKNITSGINIKYTLGIPNMEVKNAFFKHLLTSYSKYPIGKIQGLKEVVQKQIQECDATGLEQSFKLLLAKVPYLLIQENEAYYHSLFLVWLAMLDFDIQGEVMTNIGRIDAVLRFSDLTVIAELKYGNEKQLDEMLQEAMAQINDKHYYEAYIDKPIVFLCIAFCEKNLKVKFERFKINDD